MSSKKIRTYFPLFLIFLFWFIFAFPYFFQGKVPFPSTYQVNNFAPWSAYPEFWGPVKNGAMPDIITQIYPWKKLTIDTWKMGQVPLWNPYSFTGTPHLANYQSAVLSPFNMLFFLFSFVDAWTLLVLLQPLLAGIFTYIFARSISLTKFAGLLSSTAFMFCGFMTVWMGYATLPYAILFLPLSLYGIEQYYKKQKSKYLAIITLSIPLSFFSGHFQTSLYFFLFIIGYLVYRAVSSQKKMLFIDVAISIVLGLFISALQIFPSIEAYTQALRSSIFEKGEAIPWQYIPTFIAPDFFGNPVTRNDWFGHYAEWNGFIGVIPFFLAIYAILNKKNYQTLFFLISIIFTLLFAFDGPFLDFLVNLHIPVISTSAASRIIVLYSFSAAMLAGIGVDKLIEDIQGNKRNKVYPFIFLTFFIFIFLWSIVLFHLYIPTEKIVTAKSNIVLPTVLAATFISVVVISFYVKKKVIFLFYVLLLFTAFDMMRFVTKWMPFDPKNFVFPNPPVAKYFSTMSGYDRVMGNLGGEATVYYKLPVLEGYDAVYPKRYGEFIASLSDGKVKNAFRSVVLFPKDGKYTPEALQLLGVKYVVHKISDGHAGWTFPFWTYPANMFTQIYKDGSYEVYKNETTLPRVFLVKKYRIGKNDQQIIDTVFSKNFNPAEEVVLEEDPALLTTDDSGNVSIKEYTSNKVTMDVNAGGASLLVFTDNYYPGWKALVDGKELKILRANYSFRAIPISQGTHLVEFIYNPFSFQIGLGIAVIGIIGSSIFFFRRSKYASVFKN